VDHPLVQASRALFLPPITFGGEALGVAAFSITAQPAKNDFLKDLRELLSTVLKVSQTQTRHG
jgi:hypothetical protein